MSLPFVAHCVVCFDPFIPRRVVFISYENRTVDKEACCASTSEKTNLIMCHVTKYSMIRGVFQQPWPGVSPTAILNEGKALGTRLR